MLLFPFAVPIRRLFVPAAAIAALSLAPAAPAQCPSQWLPVGPGVPSPNGEVDALLVNSGNLIAAGFFTVAGPPLPLPTNRIAQWNGTNWSLVGSGFNDGVLALAAYHGQIIATGLFTGTGAPFPPDSFNYIARWDGTSWSPLGAGLDFAASALAVFNDDLIVAGTFTLAGGSPNLGIARWHDSGPGTAGAWSSFGDGLGGQLGVGVYALAVYNGELIAGGEFDTAGAFNANRIARSAGVVWQPLGGPGATLGVNSSVTALNVYNNTLVAGGVFGAAGGVPANHVARWSGAAGWSALGGGVNNTVYTFGVYGPDLYAGGQFTTVNNPPTAANRVARWNGATWSALGTGVAGGGVNGTPYAMAAYGGSLFVGGAFTSTDGQAIARLARWNAPSLACPADYDCNGAVEPADVAAFINVWFSSLQNGTLAGDYDGNGLVQPADVATFVQVWFTGASNGC